MKLVVEALLIVFLLEGLADTYRPLGNMINRSSYLFRHSSGCVQLNPSGRRRRRHRYHYMNVRITTDWALFVTAQTPNSAKKWANPSTQPAQLISYSYC